MCAGFIMFMCRNNRGTRDTALLVRTHYWHRDGNETLATLMQRRWPAPATSREALEDVFDDACGGIDVAGAVEAGATLRSPAAQQLATAKVPPSTAAMAKVGSTAAGSELELKSIDAFDADAVLRSMDSRLHIF